MCATLSHGAQQLLNRSSTAGRSADSEVPKHDIDQVFLAKPSVKLPESIQLEGEIWERVEGASKFMKFGLSLLAA